MAIIYSYPPNNNILPTDIIVSTSTAIVAGRPKNQTKSIEILNLATFVNTSASNNLNQVLINGNTSTLDAYIGNLYLYDSFYDSYGFVGFVDSNFLVTNADGAVAFNVDVNGFAVKNADNFSGYIDYSNLTANKTYYLPDNSGTIALTSDIPTVTPSALTRVNDTNITLTLGGNPSTALLDATSLTLGWTGTLADSRITSAATWNAKQNAISLTTTGSSGAATFIGNVLNIPNYAPNLSGYVPYVGATGPVNLGAYDLTVNSLTVGKGSGTGLSNTAVGNLALFSNTTGGYNTAIGNTALRFNTTGDYNVAVGHQTLVSNTTGRVNTAVGGQALNFNTTGTENVVTGFSAMLYNTTGSYNTGIGDSVMFSNLTGNYNTAVGIGAFAYNRSGSNNAALGFNAGALPSGNTVIDNSVFLGTNTKALGNNQTNQIVIGYDATGAGSNTVTLGNTSITTTRLRGAVQGGSFVKDGGTNSQYLMADGGITTVPYKYNFGGTVTSTGAISSTVNLMTITVPANSFSSLINIQSVMFEKIGTLGATTIKIWTGTTSNFNIATQIARFTCTNANLFIQISRVFAIIANNLVGCSSTQNTSTGYDAFVTPIQSTPFNPAITNYFFISVQLDGVSDTIILRNVNITT